MSSPIDIAVVIVMFATVGGTLLLRGWLLWEEFRVQRRAAALMEESVHVFDGDHSQSRSP